MKKKYFIALILILIIIQLVGCNPDQRSNNMETETSVKESTANDDSIENSDSEQSSFKEYLGDFSGSYKETGNAQNLTNDDTTMDNNKSANSYYSPFTGQVVSEQLLRKALMVVVENSPAARPQSGLEEASIVYEVLVEGGITRFIALYWDDIPEKIGPIRSVRPYMINIAREYNGLLLHAGASPDGFAILAEGDIAHLDQIYRSRYYWRSSDRRAPHNLYTGKKKIEEYLDRLIGQEYQQLFSFRQVSFIKPQDQSADIIRIPYWGGTTVIYRYNSQENQYYRFNGSVETPHILDNNKQITANNIIIQYVKTKQIDDVGRLSMDLDNRGSLIAFSDGIVVEGFWEKDTDGLSNFYNNQGEKIKLNPGQTWIELVPDTIKVEFIDTKVVNNKRDLTTDEIIEEINDIDHGKDNDIKDNDLKDNDLG